MQFGITLDRDGIATQPEPLRYLSDFAREAERLGYAYIVIGDRLESGVDPFLPLAARPRGARPERIDHLGGDPAAARHPGNGQAVRRAGRADGRTGNRRGRDRVTVPGLRG